MEFEFESVLIEWRGPAPFVFAPMSEDDSEIVKAFAKKASYGWGCIPVKAKIGATEFTTSMMPKDGRFMVPVKMLVQKTEKVAVGDLVRVQIRISFG